MTTAIEKVDMSRYTGQMVDTSKIFCDHKFNCRGRIDKEDCRELSNSLREKGLEFPIHLQPYTEKEGYEYRIVSGHRRFTAATMLGWTQIPAVVRTDIATEDDAHDLNIIENVQRRDLDLTQESEAISWYMLKGFTVDAVAKKLGKSNGWVEVRRRLAHLPDFVQNAAREGLVNQNHIHQLWANRENTQKMSDIIQQIKQRAEAGERVIYVREDVKIQEFAKVRCPKKQEVIDFAMVLGGMITNKLPEDYFAHQILAWFLGNMSLAQLYKALKAECERLELPFDPPADIKRILDGTTKI